VVTSESREIEQLRLRVVALEEVVKSRAVIVEDALIRIATLRSENKQHQAELRTVQKICDERLRVIEANANAARDREKQMLDISAENVMLVEICRERKDIIERLERQLRETGMRYVVRNRLRSIGALGARVLASARPKSKSGVS
jgi:hypothetical protein